MNKEYYAVKRDNLYLIYNHACDDFWFGDCLYGTIYEFDDLDRAMYYSNYYINSKVVKITRKTTTTEEVIWER